MSEDNITVVAGPEAHKRRLAAIEEIAVCLESLTGVLIKGPDAPEHEIAMTTAGVAAGLRRAAVHVLGRRVEAADIPPAEMKVT